MNPAPSCFVLAVFGAFALLAGACSDQNANAGAGAGGGCSSGAASAGSGSTPAATGCALLVRTIDDCYGNYCKLGSPGAGSPFCTCWQQCLNIDDGTCRCVALDKTQVCQGLNLSAFKASDYNCPAATGAVATVCVSNTQTQ